jgi:DNA repair exonuclease SbcCD ATPase subunit
MKIRSIRLANVGTFAEPTAVEGLSGRLDVLIGPNEMGKSTLLAALRTLFTERHTVTGKAVEALRARAGAGEPVIEADFDAAGAGWRVTKRFGKGRAAVLVDRASGRLVAEGPEAEERLAELVTHRGAAEGGIALLWADQGAALAPKPPEKEARPALHAVIEREVESAADGGMARKLRDAVTKALEQHVPAKRRTSAKAGSHYERALNRQAELQRALQEARSAAAAAADRLAEIARLRDELQRIGSAEAAARRLEARDKAAAAHDAGSRAALGLKSAQAEFERLAREAERVDGELATLDADLQALADLDRDIAERQARLGELEQTCAAAREAATVSERASSEATAAETKALAALVAAERREATAAARRDLAGLHATRAAAAELAGEIAAASQALALSRVDAAGLKDLEGMVRELDAHAARLAAGAPRIRIDYEPGRAAGIEIGGAAIANGAEVVAARPLQLVIPGVGTVTVTPAASAELEAAAAGARRLEDRKAELLARMGVADVAAARASLASRQQQERDIATAQARLAALAPEGVTALEERVAALAERLALHTGEETGIARQDAEAMLARSRQELQAARQRLNAAIKADEGARAQLVSLKEALAQAEQRVREISVRLPPLAVRAEERARKAAARDLARAAAREANATYLALKDTAPDEAAMSALKSAALGTADAVARAADETARLRQQIERLEGAQENADEGGVATRAGEAADELARADADVARYRREVAELSLIEEVLAKAESETRERFLSPVLARLGPYLDLVFPAARLGFGDGLQAAALTRSGIEEAIGRLSSGTQEQLAILIRLGFARLFAEAGHDVPLILDDALVYSDDERIRRMFAALSLAAGQHQVLVLTCRASAFAGLGGNRLALSPWKR